MSYARFRMLTAALDSQSDLGRLVLTMRARGCLARRPERTPNLVPITVKFLWYYGSTQFQAAVRPKLQHLEIATPLFIGRTRIARISRFFDISDLRHLSLAFDGAMA